MESQLPIEYLPERPTSYLLHGSKLRPNLLEPGHVLTAYPSLFLLEILTVGKDGLPAIVAACQLTWQEWFVLLPVIASYPDFCPYNVMHAAFNKACITEENIVEAQEILNSATASKKWDAEVRPLRNVLSRARLKIQAAFHLDVYSIFETGYLLHATSAHSSRKEETTPCRERNVECVAV
jgi:hypothetical protein